MKFKKKPVVIDAVQYTGDNYAEIKDFAMNDVFVGRGEELYVNTLEGDLHASKGDWIIKGVDNEFSPCKPDIFEKTYEPVKDFSSDSHVTLVERRTTKKGVSAWWAECSCGWKSEEYMMMVTARITGENHEKEKTYEPVEAPAKEEDVELMMGAVYRKCDGTTFPFGAETGVYIGRAKIHGAWPKFDLGGKKQCIVNATDNSFILVK